MTPGYNAPADSIRCRGAITHLNMLVQDHPLHDHVLAALRNLQQPVKLRALPLLEDPSVRTGLGNPPLEDLAVALQQRLQAIIRELQPQGEKDLKQREWLRYCILHDLFQRNEAPLAVQQDLGIGRTHFYELRNEAVESVAMRLAAIPGDPFALPPAPASFSEPIPNIPDFIGRAAELAFYRDQLLQQNLALIHGFAGTGKTALAAALAAERQQAGHSVVWVTFYAGVNTDLDGCLEILACALSELGNKTLQDFLAASMQASHPYPPDARIHYAVSCLAASKITLCLDDIHLVEEMPAIQRLLACLAPRQRPARLPMIVVSRIAPAFAQGRPITPLPGLNDQDARQLVHNAGIDWLEDKDFIQLYQRTEGNAAFLMFFTAWAQSQRNLARQEQILRARAFIAQLGRALPGQDFLLGEVVASLDATERELVERGALCRKPINLASAARARLFPDLDPEQASAALSRLERRNLLTRRGDTAIYSLHDLVRSYLAFQLDQTPARQAELHKLLIGYHTELGDIPEVAFHLYKTGDAPQAVSLLIQHADELIQNGQAIAIAKLAEEIPAATLATEQRLAWYGQLANAWQASGLYRAEASAYLCRALDLRGGDYAERYALAMAHSKAGKQPPADQDPSVAFLHSVAETLADDLRKADITLQRARHAQLAGEPPQAAAAAQAADQAQAMQSAIIKAAGYARAMLVAQELSDRPTQAEALEHLRQALGKLGHEKEAAKAQADGKHKFKRRPGA